MTDNEKLILAEKAINGDNAAFSELYELYRDDLIRFIISQGAMYFEAEDVVSETFMVAFEKIGTVKEPKAFSSWLHTIARNAYIAKVRKDSRLTFTDFSADDQRRADDAVDRAVSQEGRGDDVDDTMLVPDDYVENEYVKQFIADKINELSENHRETIFLHYYKDMKLSEIAETMGVPESTVKTRLHYAKASLRDKLKELKSRGIVLAAVPIRNILEIGEAKGCFAGTAAATAAAGTGAASAAIIKGSAGAAVVSSKIAAVITAAVVTGGVAFGTVIVMNRTQNNNDNGSNVSIIRSESEYENVSEEEQAVDASMLQNDSLGSEGETYTSRDDTTSSQRDTSSSQGGAVTTRRTTARTDSSNQETLSTRRQKETQSMQEETEPVITAAPVNTTKPEETDSSNGGTSEPEKPNESESEKNTPEAEGTWLDNKWEYSDGTLIIKGESVLPQPYYLNIPQDIVITDVIISNGITNLEGRVFMNCTTLKTVTISKSVTSIGESAFEGCTSLTSITIPDSVEYIGGYAFDGCTNLTVICPAGSYAESYCKENKIEYKTT